MDYQAAQNTISDMDAHKIQWDDNLRAQANKVLSQGNSSSGGGVDPQALTAAFKTAQDQYNAGTSKYDTANPWNFDQVLAKTAADAKGTVNPYYDQLLANYMKGVEYAKGNTIQDEMRALTKLQSDYDAYQGNSRAMLEQTMRQVGQNYGNEGGYDSGARARAQGSAAADTAYQQGQAQRDYEYSKGSTEIGANRMLNQTIPLNTLQYQQEQDRNRATDTGLTQAQDINYAQALHNYNRAQAGVANVSINDNGQFAGAFPGMSSAQTSSSLAAMLPNVQAGPSGALSMYQYQ